MFKNLFIGNVVRVILFHVTFQFNHDYNAKMPHMTMPPEMDRLFGPLKKVTIKNQNIFPSDLVFNSSMKISCFSLLFYLSVSLKTIYFSLLPTLNFKYITIYL